MTFTRNLHFSGNDLGLDAVLLLTFDNLEVEGNSKLLRDRYDACWKVVGLPSKGPFKFNIEYCHQLAFIKPQMQSENIVSPASWVQINLGEETNLEVASAEPPMTYMFTKPIPGSEGVITAVNKTDVACDIGIGVVGPDGGVSTTLLFKDCNPDVQLIVDFKPILWGYIAIDSKENQILDSQAITTCVFKSDLAVLKPTTDWVIRVQDQGVWAITQAEDS